MKKSLTAIAFLSILVSCTKENRPLSSSLISSSYQVTSYPRVYTKFGEITNRAVVDAYITEPKPGYFHLSADGTFAIASDTITYVNGDTVLFSNMPIDLGTRIMKQQGQMIYFYMKDTLPEINRTGAPLREIEREIGTFKRYEQDACYNSSGICFYLPVYDAFLATGSRQQLEFPLLSYKITRNTSLIHQSVIQTLYNNLFNPSVLNMLQDGDTLAVQTLKRVYSK